MVILDRERLRHSHRDKLITNMTCFSILFTVSY